MIRILLIEDEAPKRQNIRSLLAQLGLADDVVEAHSVGSAIRALKNAGFQLILLDMSLPTFDIGAGESGGRPQGFGGVEVLRYMDRFKVRTPTILVTAYDAFSEGGKQMDLKALEEQLRREHPNSFQELVFYDSMYSTWRDELKQKIEKVLNL